MIITDSFVMLNFPRTGSTFARKVIKDLYASRPLRWFRRRPLCAELILPNIKTSPGAPDQHGTFSQIPGQYRDRPVVSIARSPYDRFLSRYRYSYWQVNPLIPRDILMDCLPTFPNLSLDEFVEYDRLLAQHCYGASVGPQTTQFILMFSKRFPTLPLGEVDRNKVHDQLADVKLLRQENLRSELRGFLHQHGFTSIETAFIDTHERVNATPMHKYCWTKKAIDYITNHESLLIDILAANGVSYSPPNAAAA